MFFFCERKLILSWGFLVNKPWARLQTGSWSFFDNFIIHFLKMSMQIPVYIDWPNCLWLECIQLNSRSLIKVDGWPADYVKMGNRQRCFEEPIESSSSSSSSSSFVLPLSFFHLNMFMTFQFLPPSYHFFTSSDCQERIFLASKFITKTQSFGKHWYFNWVGLPPFPV